MKMRHLITGLFVSALVLGACEDPDELVMSGSENMQTLTVKGRLVSDENVEYDAVVDEAAGIITVQVPYYISDTEAVQGDLTAMKVRGSLPYGTRFEPGLRGFTIWLRVSSARWCPMWTDRAGTTRSMRLM